MSFANYLENKVLDHITGKTSYAKPTVYIGLSTADPTDDASGLAEPSGNNYARVTTSGSDWDASAAGATSNAAAITFPKASGSWGTVTHFALFDAVTSGNMLAYGALSASEAVTANDQLRFSTGALDITLG